jgi:hypothetical protein
MSVSAVTQEVAEVRSQARITRRGNETIVGGY